jgi:xanthine/uracil permease
MPLLPPLWRLPDVARRDRVVAPEERLPWPQTIAMGAQHVVAMFGATVLAPLLMGFDPNLAILMSGIGTLIFFVVVGGRVPSYLGSSFAFIGVVIAATGYGGSGPNANLGVALGGIVACGVLYTLIGAVVMSAGTRWIERLMPPVVTGAVVAVIGLNLAQVRSRTWRRPASTPGCRSSPSPASAWWRCTRAAPCSGC